MWCARSILTLVLVALPATPALAQYGRPMSEQEKKGLWRVGPFRLTPLLQLRNAGVDTNPFLTAPSATEETEVVLRAGLQAYVPVGGRIRLRGDGWFDYTSYSTALQPRALDPGGDIRAEVDVSRLTFFAGGGQFHARERYTTDIDTRIDRTEGWVNGGLQYQVTRIVGIDLGVEDRRYRYIPEDAGGEPIKLLLDRDGLAYQGRFRYGLTPLTTLLATAEALEDTFSFAEPSRATTRSYRYLAGFELGQKAVINGSLLAGVRDIPARSAGSVAPYRGPVVRALLHVPLLRQRLRLSALVDYDIHYSASVSGFEGEVLRNTYAYGRSHLTLEFDLPLQFVGRAVAGWESAEYQLPVLVDGVETTREDRVQVFGGSLLRRLGQSARFGVTALHTTRTSTLPGLDYRRWQYGLQGEFTP